MYEKGLEVMIFKLGSFSANVEDEEGRTKPAWDKNKLK